MSTLQSPNRKVKDDILRYVKVRCFKIYWINFYRFEKIIGPSTKKTLIWNQYIRHYRSLWHSVINLDNELKIFYNNANNTSRDKLKKSLKKNREEIKTKVTNRLIRDQIEFYNNKAKPNTSVQDNEDDEYVEDINDFLFDEKPGFWKHRKLSQKYVDWYFERLDKIKEEFLIICLKHIKIIEKGFSSGYLNSKKSFTPKLEFKIILQDKAEALTENLINHGFIVAGTDPELFQTLFSGFPMVEKIRWVPKIETLHQFIEAISFLFILKDDKEKWEITTRSFLCDDTEIFIKRVQKADINRIHLERRKHLKLALEPLYVLDSTVSFPMYRKTKNKNPSKPAKTSKHSKPSKPSNPSNPSNP